MRPAHQRLAGRHAAGAQIDQRLEVQLELVGAERLAQVELERAPLLHRFLHLGGEEASDRRRRRSWRRRAPCRPSSAARRRRRRRSAPWRCRSRRRCRCGGRRCRTDRPAPWRAAARATCASCWRSVPVCSTTNSSPPKRVIMSLGPDDRSEPRPPLRLQQLVADRMAERVVDRLEAVEVDQVDGDVVVALVHAGEHAVDALAELVAVGEPGELVVAARDARCAPARACAR